MPVPAAGAAHSPGRVLRRRRQGGPSHPRNCALEVPRPKAPPRSARIPTVQPGLEVVSRRPPALPAWSTGRPPRATLASPQRPRRNARAPTTITADAANLAISPASVLSVMTIDNANKPLEFGELIAATLLRSDLPRRQRRFLGNVHAGRLLPLFVHGHAKFSAALVLTNNNIYGTLSLEAIARCRPLDSRWLHRNRFRGAHQEKS